MGNRKIEVAGLYTMAEIACICSGQYPRVTCGNWALEMWPVQLRNWVFNFIWWHGMRDCYRVKDRTRELALGRSSWWMVNSPKSDFRSAGDSSGSARGLRALRNAGAPRVNCNHESRVWQLGDVSAFQEKRVWKQQCGARGTTSWPPGTGMGRDAATTCGEHADEPGSAWTKRVKSQDRWCWHRAVQGSSPGKERGPLCYVSYAHHYDFHKLFSHEHQVLTSPLLDFDVLTLMRDELCGPRKNQCPAQGPSGRCPLTPSVCCRCSVFTWTSGSWTRSLGAGAFSCTACSCVSPSWRSSTYSPSWTCPCAGNTDLPVCLPRLSSFFSVQYKTWPHPGSLGPPGQGVLSVSPALFTGLSSCLGGPGSPCPFPRSFSSLGRTCHPAPLAHPFRPPPCEDFRSPHEFSSSIWNSDWDSRKTGCYLAEARQNLLRPLLVF